MRVESRWTIGLLVVALALALGSCEEDTDDDKTSSPIDPTGTWTVCWDDVGTFILDVTEFSNGENFDFTSTTHGVDSTCAGAGTPSEDFSGIYTTGDAVDTTLAGEAVTAYELDVETPGGVLYSLIHIDEGADPQVLYLGDDEGSNNGTTPELRPTGLQEDKPRVKQE